MADLSRVWGMDDHQARAVAQTRLDHAVSEMRCLLTEQGSTWCVELSDAIAEMKRDETPEIEVIGSLAQIGMLLVVAGTA